MSCRDNYIEIDSSTPSRSGLYAVNLPGVELSMLELLTKEDQADYLAFWDMIYKRAWDNLVSDLTHAMQDKFFVDSKLVSRETSQFKEGVNTGGGLAGVTIEFQLPRYARLHIISIDLWSEQDYASPEFQVKVFDTDADGDLLSTTDQSVIAGKNTVFIDQDYEVNKVFVAFDTDNYELRPTENKRYLDSPYINYTCDECWFDCGGYLGKVVQYNGGGLNVKYNVVCSIEKFLCENINLFKQAFYYKIGLELVIERRLGNRINRYMTLTEERQDELMVYYTTEYENNLKQSVRSQHMMEDPYCFTCKRVVDKKGSTP